MTEKAFKGAPFGYQSSRFSIKGIHPKFRLPGSVDNNNSDSHIGPGYYDINDRNNSFIESRSNTELETSNWRRKLATERFSKMPYILNKEMYQEKENQKRKLGPGYYSLNNSSLECNTAVKGIMSEREPRFRESTKMSLPGPGNYGKMGIPHLEKEEHDNLRKSPGKIGVMGGGDMRPEMINTGSGVPPNRYGLPSSIELLLNKSTGRRGFYDIFSLDRGDPIKTGHLSIHPAHSMAPNHYTIKPTNILNNPDKWYHGKFYRMKQYPDKPHDRGYWDSPERMPPDPNNQLAPTTYNQKPVNFDIKRENPPAFNISSQRNDKLSNMFFTGNYNSVGPGRYDVQLYQELQHINSHENLYRSRTTANLNIHEQQVLAERLQARNIPPNQKRFVDHHPTEAEPSVHPSLITSHLQPSIRIS